MKLLLILAVMCLGALGQSCETTVTAGSGVLTAAQVNEILKAHNDARRRVSPSASEMPLLAWNEQLAAFAVTSLSGCPGMVHTSSAQRSNLAGFSYVGENLAAGSNLTPGSGGGAAAVVMWDEEKKDYTLSTQACTPNAMCGHYTQVVWAKSTQVGCAYQSCPSLSYKHYWQCNYSPGGNFNGERPYVAGTGAVCATAPAASTTAATLLLALFFVLFLII